MQTKPTWSKPQLVILMKRREEEELLQACDTATGGASAHYEACDLSYSSCGSACF